MILQGRGHWCVSPLQEPPSNRPFTELLLPGWCLDRPENLLGGAWGLLGADWVNLAQDVTWNPAEEPRRHASLVRSIRHHVLKHKNQSFIR